MEDNQEQKQFGARLKKARENIGMSRTELACALKLSENTIGQYERGARDPKTPVLIKILPLLNVSADWLLGVGYED